MPVPSHTSFHYIFDVELLPKITHVGVFPFERERRSAGHDAQPIYLGQGVENFLAHAVAEIFLIFCLAKIQEWQHSDRFLRERWERHCPVPRHSESKKSSRDDRRQHDERCQFGSCGGACQLSLKFQFVTKVFERLKQFVGALIPFIAIFAQRFADNLLKLGRSVRDVTGERRWFHFKNRRHRFSWRFASEWRMRRYHFVKDCAETPDIGALINRRAVRLFRRHVTNGSRYRPQVGLNQQYRFVCRYRHRHFLFGQLCNPEIEHFHVSVRSEHDVLRLDVAMDNACFVGGGECTRYLDRDVDRFTDLDSPTHQTLTQCFAFDQFAGYVMSCVILTDFVNRQDIWMIEPNYGARFLLKPLQALRVASKARGQEFECGLATSGNVRSQIDFAHPAGANSFRNLVVADRATDEQISLSIFNNLRRNADS